MRRVLSVSLLLLALASCECAPVVDAPTSFVVTSDATTVEVALAPFTLTMSDGARTATAMTTVSSDVDPSCAPLALGLRADDDLRDWHRPQAPRGDELW